MALMEMLAWHRAAGHLIEKLDGTTFWIDVSRFLKTQLDFHTWAVVIFSRNSPAVILASSGEEEGSDELLLRKYCQSLYLLDPFYTAVVENRRNGLYRLNEVAPDCFAKTDYYRRYFQRNVVKDEVQYSVELDADRTLCLSLGARQSYDDRAMGLLAMIQPWLLPLMRQRMYFEKMSSPLHNKLEQPRPSFPLSDENLTEREREISQLMLSGFSTKVIARRLDISIETVRSHKKHLYNKLGVNTQSELFALLWARYSAL